jgi:hypothetical protein
MTTTSTQTTQKAFTYSGNTLARAERSLLCSPFNLSLFVVMGSDRVAMGEIAGNSGLQKGYTKRPLSELSCDNDLAWLIQVGVLRREVDGQGITDSFRLTPLGRQVVEKFHGQVLPSPSWRDRLYEGFIRYFRLPL